MIVSSKVVAATAAALAIAISASAQGRATFEQPAARTSQRPTGTLTPPSNASPVAVLAQYLRDQGRDESTVGSITEVSRGSSRNEIVQGRYEQRVGGLPVYGTYAKAAFNSRGELVSVIENFVSVPAAVASARVSAQQAIDTAVKNLYPDLTSRAGFFQNPPSATRVAIPLADGSMSVGYLVETWTDRSNELNETLVGGDGTILNVESRTNNDSYNVFANNPNVTTQTVLFGPAPSTSAPSQLGWLGTGGQKTTNIAGNNVNAYLDTDANNAPDTGGTTVTDGNFGATFSATASPSTTQNRSVAVQNLFYFNNVMHDELYVHGFDEAAGNFQNSNFGLGGAANDAVNAEAQDGSGTDNANFATPTDGSHPRMQMYLWTGRGTHQVVVGSDNTAPTLLAQGAEFGAALNTTGITYPLALVADSGGVSPTDACESIASGSLSNKIAIVDRGNCDFTVKVRNAQNAGAKGVIVANNQGDSIMTMGGSDRKVTIPSVFVGQTDGTTLKGAAGQSTTIRLNPVTPLQRDGDVDSDVVFHEYCHGLTWRMIGGMSGAIAGAIGEGMSDVCALLMNEDDRIGEYAYSDPAGIRRYPYSNYPLTYAQMNSGEVHNDGEAYGAIGWYLLTEPEFAGRKVDLWNYIVDGMNYTPSTPTYEQMRDGIIKAVQNGSNPADECAIWKAFAHYGVGVGAKATVRGGRVSITESFTLPSSCSQ